MRVQSVTWAAIVGCPCDWWLVLSCSPVSPCRPSELRIKSAMTCDESRRIPHRHSRVGGNLGGRAWGDTRQPNRPNPLSLDGRGIKEPVPVPDTGAEGENDATHRHNPANPDSERQNTATPCIIPHPVDSRIGGNLWRGMWPSYWLQGSIHRAG